MTVAAGPPEQALHPVCWWERPWVIALMVLLTAIPLMWPHIAPMVDLPGHMGRYRVQLEIADAPELQHFYTFRWQLIANLGIDLLVEVLAPILGLELAVKLIVLAIPALMVLGLLLVAREVHGRLPPTAFFAVPFAYNFPFWFGFVNFALSMSLSLIAFYWWLRLGHQNKLRLRAIIFVPLSCALWVVHAFGWGTLGVLAFSAELVRQYDLGQKSRLGLGVVKAGWRAGIQCLSLVPPMALMLLWRSQSGGQTGDFFDWGFKYDWVRMVLRDRWELFDVVSLVLCLIVMAVALVTRWLTFSRNLAASTFFLAIAYLLLPRILFGSAYADMRLAPYIFAIGLIAIRAPESIKPRLAQGLALAGLAFVLVRTTATTVSTTIYDDTYTQELAALDHVPVGARLVSFVGRPCTEDWAMSRLLHMPAMAVVRRHAFSNDQWTMEGAQLLHVRYQAGWPFNRDPTEVVTQHFCQREVWRTIDDALARFPRDAFDYVWLIQPPPYDPDMVKGLRPVWRSGSSVVYQVVDRASPERAAGPGLGPDLE